jgi:hypothetical protein
MERPDLIFSYWIFAWYLLYYFIYLNVWNHNLNHILIPNPKFAIILGLIENLVVICLMFYYKTHMKLVILFIIMMCFLKLVPLYTIWKRKMSQRDILATFGLFSLYLVWVFLNKKKVADFTRSTKDLIIHNKNTLPGMRFLAGFI